MLWVIGGIALALVAIGSSFGALGTAAIVAGTAVWLRFAFRPVQAGAFVAELTRRRFE